MMLQIPFVGNRNFSFTKYSPCRHSQALLVRCRGVRRIVHCLNMLLRVQAPDEQYLDTVRHGSLLRAKFQSYGEFEIGCYTAYILVFEIIAVII